jgi:selenocysteine-specific elongation factor
MTPLTLATAGHVDHGKTALVAALTGIDTDTLEEEKRRGMTINLGYAFLDLSDGSRVGVIDVPGHRDFIHSMLAGVAGVDLALIVVAADDGVMPQTREHIDILLMLGVEKAVAALAKIDLADEDTVAMAREEVAELLAPTPLADAPIVPVSSVTGEGIEDLKEAIEAACSQCPGREPGAVVRLPIDRVFSRPGFGWVVTGTLSQGVIRPGDNLVSMPDGAPVRVKGVRVYREEATEAVAGQRVAVNLGRASRESLTRGHVLCSAGVFQGTSMVDVRLRLSEQSPRPLRRGAAVRLYIGTSQTRARAALLEEPALAVGESGLAQLRLNAPIIAARGDRFIIRDEPDTITLGGGTVIDPYPTKHVRRRVEAAEQLRQLEKASFRELIERELRRAFRPLALADLCLRLGAPLDGLQREIDALAARGVVERLAAGESPAFVHVHTLSGLRQATLDTLASHHRRKPLLSSGLGRAALIQQVQQALDRRSPPARPLMDRIVDDLLEEDLIRRVGETLALASHSPVFSERQEAARAGLTRIYFRQPFSPPHWKDVSRETDSGPEDLQAVHEAMLDSGELIPIEPYVFHRDAIKRGRQLLLEYFKTREDLRVADFRDLTQSSRAYAIPLLNFYETQGLLVREGELRRLAVRAKS